MPRQARIAFEKGFFHVFNKAVNGEILFREVADYKRFLGSLDKLNKRDDYDHKIFAYVFLPRFFHLLIQTGEVPLSKIMSSLLTGYSMYYNLKYKHSGAVFQGRFRSKLSDPKTYFLGASRYIYLLPIAEELVRQLADYPWSSYQEIFNKSEYMLIDKKEISKLIGGSPLEKENYHNFILEGIHVVKDLSQQYSFSKQVEGDPMFNVLTQRQYTREKIKRKIEGWFKIKLD